MFTKKLKVYKKKLSKNEDVFFLPEHEEDVEEGVDWIGHQGPDTLGRRQVVT